MLKKVLIVAMIFSTFALASVDYSVDIVSRYIFRGIDFGDAVNFSDPNGDLRNNSPAIQFDLSTALPFDGSYVGLWGSYGLGSNSTEKLDEIDPYIGYDFSAGGVDYSVGYTYYYLASYVEAAQVGLDGKAATNAKIAADLEQYSELWLGAAFPELALSPAITYYFGWANPADKSQYSYTAVDLSLPYDIAMTLGFAGYSGYDGDATLLTDVTFGYEYGLSEDLSAYVNYIHIVAHPAGSAQDDFSVNEDPYEIVFGLSYGGSLL